MKIIWIFLYGLLFETVNTFLLLALYYVGDKYIRCVRLTMYTVMTVLWIYVEYAEFVMKINPIKTFIAYAFVFTLAAFVIFAFCAAKSSGKSAKILMCAFVPLIIAGVFQLGQEIAVHFIWDFNEDGIAHILIILSLFIIYASAKSGLKTGKE